MSNGSRSKWADPKAKRPPRPKPVTVDARNDRRRRARGEEAYRTGWCYCCKSAHLWEEVCQP